MLHVIDFWGHGSNTDLNKRIVTIQKASVRVVLSKKPRGL